MNNFFIGTIKNNIWIFSDRELWDKWVKIQPDGQYVMREPTRLNDSRSINANNLYWKRNQEISDKTGYTKDELHEYIMQECGHFYEVDVFGKVMFIRNSSKKLNKTEFSMLFKKQDDIVGTYNDGLPEEAQIILTRTE